MTAPTDESGWLDDAPEEEEKPVSADEKSLLQKIIRTGLVQNDNDIQIQRSDPKSPLHSVKSFEELSLKPALLTGVIKMGFTAPSKIQELALPTLIANPPVNMIAQSQSGTGKSAAFILAMLSRVDHTLDFPQVVCLSPTYELALQIGEVTAKMAQYYPELSIRYAVRGEQVPRGSVITDHVIIGTPGKIMDWSTKQKFFDLSKVKVFVLDEADVMISIQGHQDQCIRIHNGLNLEECQMMLFSATYDEDVMKFAENVIPDPIIIRLKREEESVNNIIQFWIDCPTPEAKFSAIRNIYASVTIGQAIIFCHTKKASAWLAKKMEALGNKVAMICGDLSVDERIQVLDRFREGFDKVLITTNVMARGIDIPQVTFVVNYDMPQTVSGNADCETYLHRIGRTGRFGHKGLAMNLIDGPKAMNLLKQIEAHFGRPIRKLDTDDADIITSSCE